MCIELSIKIGSGLLTTKKNARTLINLERLFSL